MCSKKVNRTLVILYPEDAYQGKQPTSEMAWLRLHSSWQLVREYLGEEVIQKDELSNLGRGAQFGELLKGCNLSSVTLSLVHYKLMMCTYINSTFKISQTAIWEISRIWEYLEWKFKNSTSQGNLNTTLISFPKNN